MYCEVHDDVGCSVCFVKYHRFCGDDQIHSVQNMIGKLFNTSDCDETHGLLRDTIMAVAGILKSNETQLTSLKKAKKDAHDKVDTFQKALEFFIRKAADESRNEIENVYQQLETEILDEQQDACTISDGLQASDEKLEQCRRVGKRTHRFLCKKIADRKIKEANDLLNKHKSKQIPKIQMTFLPDHSIIKNIKRINKIGLVINHKRPRDEIQKHKLYKIKATKDINIAVADDTDQYCSKGSCLTPNNQLLVTDCNNMKIKVIDIHKRKVVDYCTLDSKPYGICCTSHNEAAVACIDQNKIQFVSIRPKIAPTRQIQTIHSCYGIACKDDKIYVTGLCRSLYVYDMAGKLLKNISHDNVGNSLFEICRHVAFNEDGSKLFVGDFENGLVCLDMIGNNVFTIKCADRYLIEGAWSDGRGNLFVVDFLYRTVMQFREDGTKVGVLIRRGNGCNFPMSVAFYKVLNRLFVTMDKSNNVVKMYELE